MVGIVQPGKLTLETLVPHSGMKFWQIHFRSSFLLLCLGKVADVQVLRLFPSHENG